MVAMHLAASWAATVFDLTIIVTVLFTAIFVFEFRDRSKPNGAGTGHAVLLIVLTAIGLFYIYDLLTSRLLPWLGAAPETTNLPALSWPGSREHFSLAAVGLIALGLFVIARGIRRLLDTSRETERRFRAFFDNAPISMSLKDRDGRFLFMSRTHEKWLGLSASEIIGKTMWEIADDPARMAYLSEAEKFVRETNQVREVTVRATKPNGQVRDHVVTKFPVKSRDGSCANVGTIAIDITERRRAEAVVRASEARLSGIVNTAPDAIILVDQTQRVTTFNRGAEQIFGHAAADVIGQPLDMLVPAAFRAAHGGQIAAFDRSPEIGRSMADRGEIAGLHKDGTVFPAEASISTLELDGETVFTVILRDISERKQRETALRDSERNLRAILEKSPMGVAVIAHPRKNDPINTRRLFVNDALVEMFGGTTTREFVQMDLSDTWVDPDQWHTVKKAIKGGADLVDFEARRRRIDGSELWVSMNTRPIRFDGQDCTMVWHFDITDRKQRETALRDSERSLRAILEVSPIGVAIVTLTRKPDHVAVKRLFVNDAFVRMFGGTTQKETIESGVQETWPDHDQMNAINGEIENGVDLVEVEARRWRLDGAELWVSMSTRPIRFDNQDCTMVWHFDITERRRAAEALKESEARLRSIIDYSPTAISLKDTKGRFLVINKKYQEWLTVSDRNFVGDTAYDLIAKKVADIATAHEKLVMKTGVPVAQERKVAFPDGVTRTVWVHKFPIFGPQEECIGVGTAILDVTEQRSTEQQLRQAQKMEAVGQLTGGIAHDFNNLLGIVIGNLDFLAEELQDDADLLALTEAATKAALSGAALNRQLLAFSRKQSLSPQVIDLNDHVLGMTDMLRRTLGVTIEVEMKQSQGPWTANVDPAQLESAVLNLAVNARDAMPAGGTLTIETMLTRLDHEYAAARSEVTPGEYVMLAVTDTGTGMAPEVLAQVFEPFFTTKDVGAGSGLGLSMVFGFTKQSGGHVEIESTLGRGTAVTLYLPHVRRAAAAACEETAPLPMAKGETVLVVEDSPELLKLVGSLLDGLGYRVLAANDGKSALTVLDGASGIDLLLTDMAMPDGMNGPALATKAAARQCGIKVLYMSGHAEDTMRHQPPLTAETAMLRKPFRRPELARMVRTALDA